ncbi:hypothetical protein ACFSKU_07190 [Pontibacter silvestris]|uniref:Uncharacterized protein n=1 Tax=Pontibacter silvestris TaxID=2305183 RepID=A0ABW4WXC9_9BACT|nr:hypothetical protein [Pontibacter silvestris]MCC9136575.1 hypothetical protein [Pontibacter silvestris]
MHRLFLTLLFLGLFANVATAQKEFANLDLPMRNAEDLVTVADSSGNVCVYVYQNGKLYFNLLSSGGEVVSSQEIPYRNNEVPEIMGNRITEDEFIFYSRHTSGRREYVRPFAINKETGAFRFVQDIELPLGRGEYFVGGFGDSNHFYMLYSDKKSNLHLFRDSEYDPAHFDRQSFEAVMPRTRERYDRESSMVYVHPDLDQTVFTGHYRSKIYTRGDKIHMIFDGYYLKGERNKVTTEILTLDWNSGSSEYRKLPVIEQKGEPSFNSFLYNNTLFRVTLKKEEVGLTAYDFNTLQLVQEYKYGGNEEITIKATPVYQRGAKALFSSDSKTIEETSKVMKNLDNGIPAITVDALTDSTLQLTIGSYQPPRGSNQSRDMSRMVHTPDRYVRTSRGLYMIPGRWTPAYNISSFYLDSPYYSRYFYDPYRGGYGQPTGPGVSTYFRAVLDSKTLAKANIEKPTLLQDKVEAYEQELKSEPDYKTVYRYGNKLHYGYYDRKSKTFRILEFSQNSQE